MSTIMEKVEKNPFRIQKNNHEDKRFKEKNLERREGEAWMGCVKSNLKMAFFIAIHYNFL